MFDNLAFADNNVTTNRYLFNGKELENYTLGSAYLGTPVQRISVN
jgi:hypothetical protein